MANILTSFAGYKTYIVSAVMVVLGVMSLVGIDIPGVSLQVDGTQLILNGMGLSALRAGVAKLG